MEQMLIRLKGLLGIDLEDKSKDAFVMFALEDAKDTILNYCHIEEIPQKLNTTIIKIALDIYRNENLGSEEESQGTVSSTSDGSTTVSFKKNEDYIKNSIVKDYTKTLNKFRKLKW